MFTRIFKVPNFDKFFSSSTIFSAKPSNTPSFYNFMNYADFGLGTWHPEKGMYSIVLAMVELAKSLGVKFYADSEIEKICVDKDGRAYGIKIKNKLVKADIVLSGADYHHSESLLDPKYRRYSEAYWNKKTFAPSSLLFYIGLDEKIKNVSHHTLFFDVDFDEHADSIYNNPSWPKDPLFYVNFPSISDSSMAPKRKRSLFYSYSYCSRN